MLEKPKETCSNCPLYGKPYGKPYGYVPASGTGDNGVLLILEAAGEHEEKEGMPLVGKAGYGLFQQLKRVGIERDGFRIHNVLSCRPPENKLLGMPYTSQAIAQCSPLLDKTIKDHKDHCKSIGKIPVLLTLGNIAFQRILNFDKTKNRDLLSKDFYAYPFWSDTYGCWVLNAPHPAYLLRGNTHLWPVVQFVFTRALEIANNGFKFDEPNYLLDPTPTGFDQWIDGFSRSLDDNPDNPLSYDIETPYKKKVKDEEEVSKEEAALNDDHTILRCSFSYALADGSTSTTSVVWDARYMAGIERLFSIAKFVLGWNSDKYDYPRVSRYVKVAGIGLDGMVAWHILNSSLRKSLGFVTPYYWQNAAMWKHLADSEPAFYNAKDADAALRCWIGIKRDLVANNLWHVYERHWIELHKALKFMSDTGVLRDNVMRDAAEAQMSTLLDGIEARMEEAVPKDAREIKVYKKTPKVITDGMFQAEKQFPAKYCAACGISRKRVWKTHTELCEGAKLAPVLIDEPQLVWLKPLAFKVSKKRLSSYQLSLKHQAIIDRKEKKVTFDADALTLLVKKYPNDKLYPTILEHRKVQKLLSVYIGVTEFKEVEVPDDYVLQSGERWKDGV